MLAHESYNKQLWAFGLNKNSPLENVLSHRMFVARQSGAWNSEFNRVISNSVACDHINEQTIFRELGYENIFSAFVVLVGGTGASLAFTTLEKVYYKSKKLKL